MVNHQEAETKDKIKILIRIPQYAQIFHIFNIIFPTLVKTSTTKKRKEMY